MEKPPYRRGSRRFLQPRHGGLEDTDEVVRAVAVVVVTLHLQISFFKKKDVKKNKQKKNGKLLEAFTQRVRTTYRVGSPPLTAFSNASVQCDPIICVLIKRGN